MTQPAPAPLAETRVVHLALDQLDLDDQTFMFRAALRFGPLKNSIQESGQQMPIIVRRSPADSERYQVISGFRRATAIRELGLQTVAAIVRDDLSDDEAAFRSSVLENCQRKTYSDIDRAHVVRSYRARGFSSVAIGELMGLSVRQIANVEKLVELPELVQAAIDDAEKPFSATHGITLKALKAKYPELDESMWVERVNVDGLSVAQLKRAVNKAHRVEGPRGLGSIFNRKGTAADDGVFRLMPLTVRVADLSDDDRASLRGELEGLLRALG